MIVALIRHGEYQQPPGVPSAHLPYPLTPEGRAQARRGAQLIIEQARHSGWRIAEEIHCSRMLRAWQTATLMAEVLQSAEGQPFRVKEYDALAERCVGAGANLTVEQIEGVLAADPRYGLPAPGWKRDSSYCLPLQGSESLIAAGARVAGHLEESLPKADSEVRLYVGHGGAFRHAAYHLGVLTLDSLARLTMAHARAVFLQRTGPSWSIVAGEFRQRGHGMAAD